MLRSCVAVLAAVTIATATSGGASVEITTLDGRRIRPFAPAGAAGILFFVATDCPISNSFAPEIQRICRDYAGRGVSCSLIYEDVDPSDDTIRTHLREYGYSAVTSTASMTGMTAAADRARIIAGHAKASITPQAVVVDRGGAIRYRGRIDNFYAALGKPRQQVTERDLRDALDDLLAGRSVRKPETQALGCHIVNPDLLRK